ncbi:aldo/keto reductase [Eupransor demetentiae]|uniref:Related to diketogulonate reductase (ARA1) n=1 Tax=Eupransor demetentiae TaxID=3109584 RepID=A0ABP0ENV1_9LACO|nr:Aldo/keto reductase [Lactobacillaceae bacterium LMG 33000]
MQKTIRLNNDIEMPLEGFGVFQVSDLDEAKTAVKLALKNGYRMLDTASSYKNEEAVGAAISESDIPREELFVTTKAYVNEMGYRRTIQAFYQSLNKLGLNYIDLYLIHMPLGDYYGAYRAMIDLYKAGKVRAIGISNFDASKLTDLLYNFDFIPQVNQIEHHPHFQRPELLKLMAERGLHAEAWAPFAEGMNGMFEEPTLEEIAKKHGKSVAQVILRWNVQQGISVIPKSVHENRMQENADIWDFELSSDEFEAISKLDRKRPSMLDTNKLSEVERLYDYLNNPVVTSLD